MTDIKGEMENLIELLKKIITNVLTALYQPFWFAVILTVFLLFLRPGEKLFEELLMAEEGMQETPNKLIHIGKPIEMDDVAFKKKLRQLDEAAYQETDRMKKLVEEVVPTYHPENAGNA